jgi:hypothetical protein
MSLNPFNFNHSAWLKIKVFFLSLFGLISFSFLVGYGSSNSSSSDYNDTISFALIKSSFSAFPDNYTISSISSSKDYNVSAAQADSFYASVIKVGSYDYERGGYFKGNVLPNIDATVHLGDKRIYLYLESDTEFEAVADDTTYKRIFRHINGDIISAHITKTYDKNENLASEFAAYATILSSPPYNFHCFCLSKDWYCHKTIGDVLYQWDSYSDISSTYRITKNGVMAVRLYERIDGLSCPIS